MTIYPPMDEDREDMNTILLAPGQSIAIRLANSDGEFVVRYGEDSLTVESDMSDIWGRDGEIYREEFGDKRPFSIEICEMTSTDDDFRRTTGEGDREMTPGERSDLTKEVLANAGIY